MKTLKSKAFVGVMLLALFGLGSCTGGGTGTGNSSVADSGGSGTGNGGSGDDNGGGSSTQKATVFLDFYHPADPTEKSLKSIVVNDSGDTEHKVITNKVYPKQGYGGRWIFSEEADASKEYCVMALNQDFDQGHSSYGTLINLLSGQDERLPLPPARDESHFSYYQEGSGKVGQNHVFYISVDHHLAYSDDTEKGYLRYDINNKDYVAAISCNSFIVGQPEKKVDTEACSRSSLFVPSTNDRYIYGDMTGWGVDGGQNHYDYTVLYQYDFDTSTYSRLGEDSSVEFAGATSDVNYLLYTNGEDKKVYNVTTGNTKTLKNISYIGSPTRAQWNNSGFLIGSRYNDILSDTTVEVVANNVNNIKSSQFSPDGKSIFFILKDEPAILYRTDDLSAGSSYHKVMDITEDDDLLVLRGVSSVPVPSSSDGSTSGSSADGSGSSSSGSSEVKKGACIWDDSVFINCRDNLTPEECTLEKLDPLDVGSGNQIFISPKSCTENGFEDFIELDDGVKEYFKTTG